MQDNVWTVSNMKADFDLISKKYGITPMLARIMVNRGINTDAGIKKYLSGGLEDLYSPFLLTDMDEAVKLLKEAFSEKKKIFIIGDYDIDGVCSAHILKEGFIFFCLRLFSSEGEDEDVLKKKIRERIFVRLPDRRRDGYGMNRQMVEEALNLGVSVIVTCDNGIAAREEIGFAKEKGLRVLVTDHHEVPFEESDEGKKYILPPADAVIDPMREDGSYPFKGICGAVVAYKLITGLYTSLGEAAQEGGSFFELIKESLNDLLVFAAFATVGDIMELRDENRIIVKYGLSEIKKGKNPGLRALMDVNEIGSKEITPYHVGFILGPCINAAGRLDIADKAFRLFEEEDEEKAMKTALELKGLNDKRKELQNFYTEKAISMIDSDESYGRDRVLVIYIGDCHESLAGLIAGKLKERYYKPSFVITDTEDGSKGSGRSIEAYDMYEEMSRVKELFTKFGGHKMAAGFSLQRENIGLMRKRLNDNCGLKEEDMKRKLRADMQLNIRGASPEFAKELKRLSPYGNGNPKPLFAEKGLRIVKRQILGKNRNVVKLSVAHNKEFENGRLKDWGALREAIIYGDGEEILDEMKDHDTVMLMYEIDLNVYNGEENVQLVVKDYKL